MNRLVELTLVSGACWILAMAGCSRGSETLTPPELLERGRELFARHCSGCHPDGGNIAYPQKTLHRIDLAANGINAPAGIVAKMRHPDRGMRQFDKAAISDHDASAIAQYILATFR
jgi:cytochrome c6